MGGSEGPRGTNCRTHHLENLSHSLYLTPPSCQDSRRWGGWGVPFKLSQVGGATAGAVTLAFLPGLPQGPGQPAQQLFLLQAAWPCREHWSSVKVSGPTVAAQGPTERKPNLS